MKKEERQEYTAERKVRGTARCHLAPIGWKVAIMAAALAFCPLSILFLFSHVSLLFLFDFVLISS